MTGTYPLVKLTELVLLAQWHERVDFGALLADACERGILRADAMFYRFGDPALQARLAVDHEAVLLARGAKQAARAARTGARSALLAFLTPSRITRISVDFGVGATGVLVAKIVAYDDLLGAGWGAVPFMALTGAVILGIACAVAAGLLYGLAQSARWTLANIPGFSCKARLAVAVAAAAAAGLVVAEAGTALAALVSAVLPAALVAACGLWACLLALRKARASSGRWRKLAPDVIAVAATGATLLVLVQRNLLTTEPASGLLFPVAAWGSVLIWRTMNGSDRLLVKAGADITLSLLLGAELVLFLVWLANLLGLSRTEVAALRAVLDRAGSAADLPWWLWTGLYVLLAAASVAFALWPARLTTVIRWFGRLRVVPAVYTTRRALTCVHIGLLTIVLVGLTASAALAPMLGRQVKATYTVALQREFQAEGELAAYTRIRREFVSRTATPVLAGLVRKIHDVSGPPPGDSSATSTETDLQAVALAARTPSSLSAAAQAAAGEAGLAGPVRDAPDLNGRLGTVDKLQKADDEAAKRAERAGDLAAVAVASTISIPIPNISDNEVFQIVRST